MHDEYSGVNLAKHPVALMSSFHFNALKKRREHHGAICVAEGIRKEYENSLSGSKNGAIWQTESFYYRQERCVVVSLGVTQDASGSDYRGSRYDTDFPTVNFNVYVDFAKVEGKKTEFTNIFTGRHTFYRGDLGVERYEWQDCYAWKLISWLARRGQHPDDNSFTKIKQLNLTQVQLREIAFYFLSPAYGGNHITEEFYRKQPGLCAAVYAETLFSIKERRYGYYPRGREVKFVGAEAEDPVRDWKDVLNSTLPFCVDRILDCRKLNDLLGLDEEQTIEEE